VTVKKVEGLAKWQHITGTHSHQDQGRSIDDILVAFSNRDLKPLCQQGTTLQVSRGEDDVPVRRGPD
jgi:hypothetical protein